MIEEWTPPNLDGVSPVDVLAVGAHPDDVELGIGGILHKLASHGYSVAILDLTRGEMSSRGTVEERAAEAAEAARILGVARRENAGLPDSGVANTQEYQRRVIPYVRAFRPRMLMATMARDRHPDHHRAHELVRDAAYFAGLARIDTGQAPYRPSVVYYYHPYYEDSQPTLVVDISDHFEAKMASLRAHASQFHNPDYSGVQTFISSASFWESIQTRAAYWGSRIRAKYGEPLYTDGTMGVAFPPGLEKP